MTKFFNNIINRRSLDVSMPETPATVETEPQRAARIIQDASVRFADRVTLLERKLEANGPQLTEEAREQVSAWLSQQHDRLQQALRKGREKAPPLRLGGDA